MAKIKKRSGKGWRSIEVSDIKGESKEECRKVGQALQDWLNEKKGDKPK